jgi:hypothetical protein
MIGLGTNYMTEKEVTNLIRVPIGDGAFLIMQHWNACLRRQYGDYMKLPSMEMQQGHHTGLPEPFTPCNHKEILNWNNGVKAL